MSEMSTEIVNIVYQLLPGFIVAWIFYGLTAYQKPTPFERIVQALIFTVLVKAILIISKPIAIQLGRIYSFGAWTENVEFIMSIFYAILGGLFLTWCVNNDFPLYLFRKNDVKNHNRFMNWINRFLSKLKLTEKTLYPNEWYSSFSSNERYIVLYLKGGQRLYGWPKQYPDDPNAGHFIITEPEWLLNDGTSAPLYTVKEMLVPTMEVERVDFLKMDSEVTASESEQKEVKEKLVKLQNDKD
jgi:hypothetical protein